MAKQLPKRDLENVGLGVTGACVALVTLVVAVLIFMVAQKGAWLLSRTASLSSFFTGTKWDLANTAENGLPYTGALPLIVTAFAGYGALHAHRAAHRHRLCHLCGRDPA